MIELLMAKNPLHMPQVVNTVQCMDAIALMQMLPDASVDMILTDPPYAVHEAEWDKPFDIAGFWREAKRIIKPRHAIVMTCVMRLAWQLIAANPDWFKYDMVGNKNIATDFVNAHNKPMRAHENILVFSDGTTANKSPNLMTYYPQMQPGKAWRKKDYAHSKGNSVFGGRNRAAFATDKWREGNDRFPTTVIPQRTMNFHNVHPNQKDIELFDYLIRSYTLIDDIVLDPFAGSGTTGRAARKLGRNYILNDITPKYVDMATRYLAQPYMVNMFETLLAEPSA